jgi:hypothetical protein
MNHPLDLLPQPALSLLNKSSFVGSIILSNLGGLIIYKYYYHPIKVVMNYYDVGIIQ